MLIAILGLVQSALAQKFQNTPGVVGFVPADGQSIAQNEKTTLQAQYTNRRVIGKQANDMVPELEKWFLKLEESDGSGNVTLAEKKSANVIRVMEPWDVASSKLDVGDYEVLFVLTPNTSLAFPPGVATRANTTTSSQPAATPPVAPIPPQTGGLPLVSYWRGSFKIVAPVDNKGNAAQGLVHGQSLGIRSIVVKMLIALGAVASAFIISL
ncbi:hypothetical protein BGZ94_009125 [Podila epigama]|nr:hypothetical protein BGZ94_009125 [Podila epigama]